MAKRNKSTFPREPTPEEKKRIAKDLFEHKPFKKIDFRGVWLLAPLDCMLDFNCMGWSILEPQSISIPDKLSTYLYLAGNAVKTYAAPFDYTPTGYGDADAVIRVWGEGDDHVMHASRLCTKELLKTYGDNFQLKLNFDARDARGFPEEIWSSKYGDKMALITHPKNWLEGGPWGKGLEDLKVQDKKKKK